MKAVGLWVPDEVHELWVRKIPREKKEVLKLAFVEMVRKHAEIRVDVRQEQSTTIYNVVMPHIEVKPVIKNENRNENVQGDPEVAREYVKALEADIQRLKKVLQAKNEEIKRLRSTLDKVRMFAAHRDIYSIRKLLGV